jgi:hypothetical protein
MVIRCGPGAPLSGGLLRAHDHVRRVPAGGRPPHAPRQTTGAGADSHLQPYPEHETAGIPRSREVARRRCGFRAGAETHGTAPVRRDYLAVRDESAHLLLGHRGRNRMVRYTLPELPYDYSALEPHYSAKLLALHHDEHHAGYVTGANTALEKLSEARAKGDFAAINQVRRREALRQRAHARSGAIGLDRRVVSCCDP